MTLCYTQDMEKRPIAEEIGGEELALLLNPENYDEVARRLEVEVDKIQKLIKRDASAISLIKTAQAEMEAWSRLRAAMMVPEALDALQSVMRQQVDQKGAVATVKAAEAVLDRTFMPRTSARLIQNIETPGTHQTLPSLDELMENADDDADALEIFQRHREILKDIDALRHGAKEIIDVRPENKTGS